MQGTTLKALQQEFPSVRRYKTQSFYYVQIGSNCLYFSYDVPIAAAINGTLYVTTDKYSVTTSKHVNMARGMEIGLEVEKVNESKLQELAAQFRGI